MILQCLFLQLQRKTEQFKFLAKDLQETEERAFSLQSINNQFRDYGEKLSG